MCVCAGLDPCSRSAACQNQEAFANHCCCSWTCVKQAGAPLPFAGFALSGFEFGPAYRVNPIILDSYALFGGESIEQGVEHGRWDSPEFSLEIGLSQALFRRPFEGREQQAVGLAKRVKMCGSEGGGSLRVPWGEAGGGIEGIRQVPQQRAPADDLIRKRRAPKEPSGPGIETTAPDCGGLLGAGDQLAHAVRNRANTGKELFGEFSEGLTIGSARTEHWVFLRTVSHQFWLTTRQLARAEAFSRLALEFCQITGLVSTMPSSRARQLTP